MSTATALTPDEVRALPAMLTSAQAFAALAVGETLGYELINSGQFPVEAIRFGRVYRFRKADVMALLGLSETAAAEVQSAPATTDDDAPGVQPGAPSEQPEPTSASK
ncbi:helix-turn-helix domain-containing protein [Streptomyces longwoodensis]|uniref:helix-turn-helix domain-containing protein n=1 Tax=Streptomyces longwoodensis TaxID=68231 RepID=UPI0033CB7F63